MVLRPWLGGLAVAAAALLLVPSAGADVGPGGVDTAPPDDARIRSVVANQGSGNQGVTPYAAGAPTVVQVLSDTSHGFVPVYIVLRGYRVDGNLVTELPHSPLVPAQPVAQIVLSPLSVTETQFLLPSSWTQPGGLLLTAQLLPVHTYFPDAADCRSVFCRANNSATIGTLHFVDIGVIRLHEVSETGLQGGTIGPAMTVDGVVSDLQALQPIASGDLHFARSGEVSLTDLNSTVPRSKIPMLQCYSTRQPDGCPKGPDANGDGDVDTIDPTYVGGQTAVFTGLARLDLLTAGERCNGSTLHNSCFDDALGMSPNMSSGRTIGQIGTEVEAHQQVGVGPTGGRGTVHEFNHSLGRGHVNGGTGCVSDELGAPIGIDLNWPYSDNVIHSTGIDTRPNSAGPGTGRFRVVQSAAPDLPVYEVMSYCHDTDAPIAPTDWWVDAYGRRLATSFLADREQPSPANAVTGIEVRAQLDTDGKVVSTYVYPAIDVPFPLDLGQPEVQITEFGNSSGVALGTLHRGGGTLYGFVPMSFGNGAPQLGSVSINGTIVLGASRSAPTVRITSATALLGGGFKVNWSAADGDGDPLIVAVDYAPIAGGPWRTLWVGPDLNHTALSFKPGLLPGYGGLIAPRVRVRVGDQTLWDAATKVLAPEPVQKPLVYIGDPTRLLTSVNQGSPVTLTGSATDQFLGSITGAQLRWTEGSNLLGTGSRLSATWLKTGPHTVKLTATDNAGHSAFATKTINVSPTVPLLLGLTATLTGGGATLTFTPTLPGKLYAYGPGTVGLIPKSVSAVPTTIRLPIPAGAGPIDLHLVLVNGTKRSTWTVTVDRPVLDLP